MTAGQSEAPGPLFTVFTPTYNRRPLLHRVFESLTAQTLRDFEWIVVDDGSTDQSKELIEDFIKTAGFPCRLLVLEQNSGKHMAWNLAVQHAVGELFVVADSDDAFAGDSLETFAETWRLIPEKDRASFSGINCLCKDSGTGTVVGDPYPDSPFDSNALELAYVHKVRGEKWGCVRTDLLRATPFPATSGSHFAENSIWMTLARQYKVRCINKALRIFFDDIRPDRLTQERTARATPEKFEAAYAWNAMHLNMNWDYVIRDPREFLITIANLGRSGLILGRHPSATANKLEKPWLRFLYWLTLPLSYFLFRRDVARGRVEARPAA